MLYAGAIFLSNRCGGTMLRALERAFNSKLLAGWSTWKHTNLSMATPQHILEKAIAARMDAKQVTNVSVDLSSRQIYLAHAINFQPGTAKVKDEDKHILADVCQTVRILDEVHRSFGDDPLHLIVQGHVHKTKNLRKCMLLSQERAEELVKLIALAGVLPEMLHAVGLGASVPIGNAHENRRVELFLMNSSEYIVWMEQNRKEMMLQTPTLARKRV